ncbi:MAG: homoserine dehydrogenase [Nitrospirae bacterium]|nr:MAG: homoserine dehydrogenase [Nitrospirota bacterium]
MRVNVGVIGFGTVGSGTVRILLENKEVIQKKTDVEVVLKRIADLDIETDRGIRLPDGVLTTNAMELIEDPEIDIVVELIGGISPAKEFILKALDRGKHVVTANKALLATEGEDIFSLAIQKNLCLGFEASVAGGIPIIKVVKEGLTANNILNIYGIINGTSNYILTKMTQEGIDFSEALKEAQQRGYAEADPTFDIEGIDSAHKLTLLASLAFGIPLSYKSLYVEGISGIKAMDIEFARELGYKIKLLAIAKLINGEVELRVHPTMIPDEYLISKVDGVLNALYVEGDAVGETLYYGRGAGDMPTGSAVVADIIDIARRIRDGVRGDRDLAFLGSESSLKVKPIGEIESMYYFRCTALDRPGVLSKISGILGEHQISIASVIQKGRKVGEAVPLVLLTHTARERDVQEAIERIDRLDVVSGKTVVIRVEGGRE